MSRRGEGVWAATLYRALLVCYPRAFREEFGHEMTEIFRAQYRDAGRTRGRSGRGRLWLSVLRDALLVATAERLSLVVDDLRYAARSLLRNPGYSVVAVATIAIGIGATTTVFSVVHGVLLKPVSFPDPGRLVMVFLNESERGVPRASFSLADFIDWRTHDRAFERGAAFGTIGGDFTLVGSGEPDQVPGVHVTSDFFTVLGVRPRLGRFFDSGAGEPGRVRSLVISERLWRRRGSDPRAVGSTLLLNGEPHTIVGVAPASFAYPSRDTDAWAILPLTPPSFRGPYYLFGVARLRPGLTPTEAEARLQSVPLGLRSGAAPGQEALRFSVVPLHEQMVGEARPMLLLLLASVAVLLLIALANVANLQVARATARSRELATRQSLGAGRWPVARQQLAESLVLGLTGGGLGVLCAVSAVSLLRWSAPDSLPRADDIAIDLPVLGVAVVVSLLSGVLVGLAPAVRAANADLVPTLNEGGRAGTWGRERARVRVGLTVVQIASSCVLLVGAGLLVRSFMTLQQVTLGFERTELVSVKLAASGPRYEDDATTRTFFRELRERVRTIPGVQAAAFASTTPPGHGGFSENITIEGGAADEHPVVFLPVVQPEYFETVGLPLRAGRYFSESDTAGGPRVTIISEALAQRYYPDQDPVGRRLRIGGPERPNTPWLEIVGVVGDVRYRGLDAPADPVFYVPHAQLTLQWMYLIVRSALPLPALRAALREQVAAVDGTIPVPEPRRLDDLLHASVAEPRFRTWLVTAFGTVALLIAAVGLYGLVGYGVEQRRQELGIRIALGARPRAVSWAVLREALTVSVLGVAVGVALALALQELVEEFLFGIAPTDALTFTAVIGVLVGTCLLASYFPARRAGRVDPMTCLRAD